MSLPYDASQASLLRPELRESFFRSGPPPSTEALAAEAARLAYVRFDESPEEVLRLRADLAWAGFAEPTLFNDPETGSQGYGTLRGDGLALLAFRGTQGDKPLDLLTDLRFPKRPAPFGRGEVHAGFRAAALGLQAPVERWLAGPAAGRRRLLVCGHSLGAAVATLFALHLRADELVTIGSPRVGDAVFASELDASPVAVTRIVDHIDMVTQVAPRWMGYRHAGRAVWIDVNGQMSADRPPADTDADLDPAAVPGLLAHLLPLSPGLPRALTDHSPVNYLRAFWP